MNPLRFVHPGCTMCVQSNSVFLLVVNLTDYSSGKSSQVCAQAKKTRIHRDLNHQPPNLIYDALDHRTTVPCFIKSCLLKNSLQNTKSYLWRLVRSTKLCSNIKLVNNLNALSTQ